jgi:hypothetical protein
MSMWSKTQIEARFVWCGRWKGGVWGSLSVVCKGCVDGVRHYERVWIVRWISLTINSSSTYYSDLNYLREIIPLLLCDNNYSPFCFRGLSYDWF